MLIFCLQIVVCIKNKHKIAVYCNVQYTSLKVLSFAVLFIFLNLYLFAYRKTKLESVCHEAHFQIFPCNNKHSGLS